LQNSRWADDLHRQLARTSTQLPRYVRLHGAMQALLGRTATATALPGERALAKLSGFSRVTVRRAIAELAASGLVHAQAGRGTYVGRRLVRSLSTLTGFTEDLRARGMQPGVRILEKSTGKATRIEARALRIPTGSPVLRLRRLRSGDRQPLALEWTVVPRAILAKPALITGSLYEALETLGLRPAFATQRIRAVAIDPVAARLLNVSAQSPGLQIERCAWLADSRRVEFTRAIYRGDAYEFVAELS
jgi:GntR family transcriptional regulator